MNITWLFAKPMLVAQIPKFMNKILKCLTDLKKKQQQVYAFKISSKQIISHSRFHSFSIPDLSISVLLPSVSEWPSFKLANAISFESAGVNGLLSLSLKYRTNSSS